VNHAWQVTLHDLELAGIGTEAATRNSCFSQPNGGVNFASSGIFENPLKAQGSVY